MNFLSSRSDVENKQYLPNHRFVETSTESKYVWKQEGW